MPEDRQHSGASRAPGSTASDQECMQHEVRRHSAHLWLTAGQPKRSGRKCRGLCWSSGLQRSFLHSRFLGSLTFRLAAAHKNQSSLSQAPVFKCQKYCSSWARGSGGWGGPPGLPKLRVEVLAVSSGMPHTHCKLNVGKTQHRGEFGRLGARTLS